MHHLLVFGMILCDGLLFLFRGIGQATADAGQMSTLDFTSTSHRPNGIAPILVVWLLGPYHKMKRLMSLGFAGPALKNLQAQGLMPKLLGAHRPISLTIGMLAMQSHFTSDGLILQGTSN